MQVHQLPHLRRSGCERAGLHRSQRSIYTYFYERCGFPPALVTVSLAMLQPSHCRPLAPAWCPPEPQFWSPERFREAPPQECLCIGEEGNPPIGA